MIDNNSAADCTIVLKWQCLREST